MVVVQSKQASKLFLTKKESRAGCGTGGGACVHKSVVASNPTVSVLCTYFHTMLPLEHGILYILIVVV